MNIGHHSTPEPHPQGPRIGSVCTGYGGLDAVLALVLGARTVWVADNDADVSKLLAARFADVPNLGDIMGVCDSPFDDVGDLNLPRLLSASNVLDRVPHRLLLASRALGTQRAAKDSNLARLVLETGLHPVRYP